MTTRQRLDLLSRAYPRLFPRAECVRLMRVQLGHLDALDRWIHRDGARIRARAPKTIYHICAGNLAVSAWTSLTHGLLLGARNVVKLPAPREDSQTRREILNFIRGLPAPLRRLVEVHDKIDSTRFAQAEVIIAFGSDATMAGLHARTRWDQKFIPHGHALSLLWIADPDRLTARQARACAIDILTYDQLGCLSPQAIYLPPRIDLDRLARQLSAALQKEWLSIDPSPARPLGTAARIQEARDLAFARGHRVWLPPGRHLGWTLIHDPDPTFQPSSLHGIIHLRQASERQLPQALASVAGRISTVGVVTPKSPASRTSSRCEELFLNLGVSRFCEAGRMQFPPLTWHHDGRPTLGELVTWIGADPGV